MASVQSNPDMGQGTLPGNITKEQIQNVFKVRTTVATCLAPGASTYE